MKSVRQILRDHGIRPRKKLGQNFLSDFSIMQKIVDIAEIRKDESVVEIGSGLGLMTSMVADKAGHVDAVEIDEKLASILKFRLKDYQNVKVIQGDILRYTFSASSYEGLNKKLKVIGNIPYNISSPILFHILEQRNNLALAVLMMQKEVADRLCAVPGTKAYGIPSILFGLYASISRELSVLPASFYPEPEVDSTVVKIRILEEPRFPVNDSILFSRLVRTAFAQRRKKLTNNLKSADFPGCDIEHIKGILRTHSIDERIRAEELSIDQFVRISNAISNFEKRKNILDNPKVCL